MTSPDSKSPIAERFRGFLPVVVDVETAGFNPRRDALLEIAAVGAFMAGWCLTCLFGDYALAILAVIALLILLGIDDLVRRRI